MNPNRLLLLVLILFAAAVGLQFLGRGDDPFRGEVELPPAVASPLLRGEPGELERLTIHHTALGLMVRVTRGEDGSWAMAEPLIDRAEPVVVQGALRALFGAGWAEAPAAWSQRSDADLGLDPARFVVEADYAGGSSETLRIGAEDVSGDWFAGERGGERVRVVTQVARFLQRPAQDWRDRRVFVRPGEVTRIENQRADGTGWVLERSEGAWHLVEPVRVRLDPLAENAVARLLGARIELLPEAPITGKAVLELEAAGDLLRVVSRDRTQVLHWRNRMAWAEDRAYLLELPSGAFGVLERDPEQLRSRMLVHFEPREVVSVRLERGGRDLLLRRQGAAWSAPGGVVLHAADPDRNRPDHPDKLLTEQLIGFVCSLRLQAGEPVPASQPSGRFTLSRSRTPQERGSAAVVWWAGEEGTTLLVAAEGAGEGVRADGFNLDSGVATLIREVEALRAER